MEKLCWPTLKVLDFVLPIDKLPELAFVIIVILFFIAVDFILMVFSVLSIYTHLSHILIALTIISWGSSPIELINLMIAAKKNELQIGLTSILSGVVFAFFILMPFAMIFKMLKRGVHEIEIISPLHTSTMLFVPALVMAVFTGFIYWKTSMKFGKISASLLIIGYVVYIGFMTYILIGDDRS
jgi:Ca2+/Na+ antiporter